MTVSTEIHAGFQRRGYHLERGVFERTQMAELEFEFDRIVAQLHASDENINARWDSAGLQHDSRDDVVVHSHNVQNYSARWAEALRNPRLLDVVETLIGPDIVLHHSKLFQKPAGHGAAFPMHQDWHYFPTRDDSMIAAMIHVSPATVDMGCVHVADGSHRIGRHSSTSGRPLWDDPDDFVQFGEDFTFERATAIEAEPGDVLFFSYFAVHGSTPNRSARSRKTVLAQLFSGTDLLEASEHPVSGLVLRGWNHHTTRSSAAP